MVKRSLICSHLRGCQPVGYREPSGSVEALKRDRHIPTDTPEREGEREGRGTKEIRARKKERKGGRKEREGEREGDGEGKLKRLWEGPGLGTRATEALSTAVEGEDEHD